MRRATSFILAVVITCSLMLTVQHSILAQAKSKQESQRDMRKIKAKDGIKSEETQISGLERYRAIIQNNLFVPLGSGDEVKREEFVLIGTMGKSAFIQMEGSDKTFYVAEGQSFGNDAKLVQVRENSATIIHEGNRKELELASGTLASQGGDAKGGGTGRRQESSGKDGGKMGTAGRAGKESLSGGEKGGGDGGEKQRGDNSWARNMSIDELSKAREDIERHLEGLRAKGVTDPKEYEGAVKKMEMVEDAIAEKESPNGN